VLTDGAANMARVGCIGARNAAVVTIATPAIDAVRCAHRHPACIASPLGQDGR
jgi:hypothetical protein